MNEDPKTALPGSQTVELRSYGKVHKEVIKPALQQAKNYYDAGVMFVPVPAFSYEEAAALAQMASERLKEAAEASKAQSGKMEA